MIPCITLVTLNHLVKWVWLLTGTVYCNAYVLQLRVTDSANLPCFGESCKFLAFKALNQMWPHSFLIKSDGCNVVTLGGMVSSSDAEQPTVVWSFLLLLDWHHGHQQGMLGDKWSIHQGNLKLSTGSQLAFKATVEEMYFTINQSCSNPMMTFLNKENLQSWMGNKLLFIV